MALDSNKINATGSLGSVAREWARMAEKHASWCNSFTQSDAISKQLQELSQVGSVYAKLAEELQGPAIDIAAQYKGLLGEDSLVMQTIRQWQETQQAQQESIRELLEPLETIHKSGIHANSTQQLLKGMARIGSITDQFKGMLEQTSALDSVTKMGAWQHEDSPFQAIRRFEDTTVGASIQSYLKGFEHINKRWTAPDEVLGLVGSLNKLQGRLGKLTLPTIDWGSAAALATTLGREGLEEQLAYLGIEPDGTLHEPSELPEKGILSRKQTDAVALLSLLLSFLFFIYQEAFKQQDTKNEAFQAQTTQALQFQANQIQSLTALIKQALMAAAQEPEERFVVRERIATVRSKPEHGSSVEGKLLPNEVVRAIDKDGKWIEIEYYHWLHEEYRTGWVLKKYLERVPASYSRTSTQ